MLRKRYPRALRRCTVNLWKRQEPRSINCVTKNIGVGGVCIVLQEELMVAEEARLQIDLDDGLPLVECQASVRWTLGYRSNMNPPPAVTHYEIGLQFRDVSKTDQDRIESLVARYV